MTKFNLSFLVMLVMTLPLTCLAQPKMLSFGDPGTGTRHNFYLDYVGARVTVLSPSSIAGPLTNTIANDGNGGANEWGGSIAGSPINGADIVKAAPYEACGVLTNPTDINGKVALVKRGNCEFGAKALEAENAGAIAVIIVNNVPGPPVGMGAGAKGGSVTIPVIMVSDVDGAAIEAALSGGSVSIAMRVWSNGYTSDVGFVNSGVSLYHAHSIPLNQISGSSSDILKGFDGAVIANYGSATANTIKVKATVSWTPGTPGSISGTPTVVHQDSVEITTPFTQADSIITPIFDNAYTLNPTGTGRYDVEYEVIPDFTDEFLGDNKTSYSFYVDNRVYSKSNFNFTKGEPISAIRTALAGDPVPSFMHGALYYVEKGGYQIERVMFSTFNTDTVTSMDGKDPVDIAIYSWKDANSDGILHADECKLVGFSNYVFKAGDTSGQVHNVEIKDAIDVNIPTVTEDNTWYWATISMPGEMLLGYDGELNYYPRSWGRSKASTPVKESFAPFFGGGNYAAFDATAGTNTVPSSFPYDLNAFGPSLEDSVRFAVQKQGLVPTIAMQMSLFKVDVNNIEKKSAFDINIFPNPVSDVLNVSLELPEEANEVNYRVFSMFGSNVDDVVTHNNVTNDSYSFNTGKLAAGTYYLAITVDGKSQVRKFTVIK